jgi:putative transposase
MMPNHVHDMTTPPSVETMSACVKRFAQRYAQIRNAKRGDSGKLFEERFYSRPIENERHLIAATVYIDANPLRAGIAKNALDYPWSTYALHVGEPNRSAIPRSLWSPSPWYLSLGSSARKRADVYRELFDSYVAKDDFSEFEHLKYLDDSPHRRVWRPNGSRAAESQFVAKRPVIAKK